jgi:undecaprenyl-diphosphatase
MAEKEGRRDLTLMIGLLAVFALGWGFVYIADEVRDEGKSQRLDERILRAMRQVDDPSKPIGPPMLEEIARDLTALGSTVVLALVVFSVAGWLAMSGRPRSALYLVIAVVGGSALGALLKTGYARPRPDVVPHLQYVPTSSFPSGHTMISAVVYFTLGALVSQFSRTVKQRVFPIAVATAVACVVGVSRVFLGVHYPTDVLAGFAAGLAWSMLCWFALKPLRRSGLVEKTEGTDA